MTTDWRWHEFTLQQRFTYRFYIISAFSAPTFTFSNGILAARAGRWFPKPNVTWLDQVQNVLPGRTSSTQNSAGIYSVVSTLQPINVSEVYTCRIKNELVASISEAKITGILVSNRFICFTRLNLSVDVSWTDMLMIIQTVRHFSSPVYSSQGALILWEQFHKVFCGSEGAL